MNAVDILFYFFATLSVGGGLLMIMSRHPVPAALFMIISLVSVAALFVLLEAFFLAILQVLVYAGAVMVLFLFIIMLLDIGPDGGKVSRIKVISGLAGCLSFGILVVLLLQFSGIGSAESGSWQEIQTTEQVNGDSLLFSTSLNVQNALIHYHEDQTSSKKATKIDSLHLVPFVFAILILLPVHT